MRECGTRAKYVHDKCRCKDCTASNTAYHHERKRWVGEFPTVPPARVDESHARDLIEDLREQGWGLRSIEQVSGIARSVLQRIVHERHETGTILRSTHERLVKASEHLTDTPDHARIPAGPTLRLVDWLLAHGWTETRINREILGNAGRGLSVGRTGMVLGRTARLIRNAYEYEKDMRAPLHVRIEDLLSTRWDEWFTYREISDELGTNEPAVRRALAADRRPAWAQTRVGDRGEIMFRHQPEETPID